jgi:hypothetical protein
MNSKPQAEVPVPTVHEVQHLRRALARLERIGATNSPTIDSLKRILWLRIAELDCLLDRRSRAQA